MTRSSPPRLFIISDDLTGALDSSAPFAAAGIPTCVLHGGGPLRRTRAAVVAIDTESRRLPEAEAADAVSRTVKAALLRRPDVLFKKTDSLLRGNVAAELIAFMKAAGTKELPFAPAFPAAGRCTAGGIQFAEGIPVGRGPLHRRERAAGRSIPELFRGFPVKLRTVGVDLIRGGRIPPPPAEPTITVFDGETTEDLRILIRLLVCSRRHGFLAGCGGFASALAGVLDLPKNGGAGGRMLRRHRPRTFSGPLFVVNGSVTSLVRRQISTAAEAGFFVRSLGPDLHFVPDLADTPGGKRVAAELSSRLRRGDSCS